MPAPLALPGVPLSFRPVAPSRGPLPPHTHTWTLGGLRGGYQRTLNSQGLTWAQHQPWVIERTQQLALSQAVPASPSTRATLGPGRSPVQPAQGSRFHLGTCFPTVHHRADGVPAQNRTAPSARPPSLATLPSGAAQWHPAGALCPLAGTKDRPREFKKVRLKPAQGGGAARSGC